jgi:mannan polymerase II complex MNN10 subunit
MSLSRSPSPQRAGGWSSPGLTTPYNSTSRTASPARSYANGSANNVTWATAQARSAEIRGYPSFSPRNQGFSRHFRRLSTKLPYFGSGDYSDKEKLGRGRLSGPGAGRLNGIMARIGRSIWRLRARFAIVLLIVLFYVLFWVTR